MLDEVDTEQNQLFSAEGSSHVTGGKSGFFCFVCFDCLFVLSFGKIFYSLTTFVENVYRLWILLQ